MPADRRLVALVDGFTSARESLRERIERLVIAEIERFDGWYSPALVDELVAQVARHVSVGQVGTARLTDAYLSRSTSYVLERAVSPAGVAAGVAGTLREGVESHGQVYARVAEQYRYGRSLGASEAQALELALSRARSMVAGDLGLAFQRQLRDFGRVASISFYRRVVRPELSRDGSCGLCVAASDRQYRASDLLPMHERCKCTVLATTRTADPGSQLNDDTLGELYDAAGSTAAADLKRTRVTVVQHGELGPRLRVAGQRFRGPSDVVA